MVHRWWQQHAVALVGDTEQMLCLLIEAAAELSFEEVAADGERVTASTEQNELKSVGN
jgi:hypothetical protein